MKHSKLIAAGSLCGALLISGAYAAVIWATPSGQPIYVDGVKTEMSVYNIRDNNYLRLREVAQAVDFDVRYDAQTGRVSIVAGTPYSGEAVQPVPAVTVQATVSGQPIYINDKRADLTAYQIAGSNYIKLREIGAAVGFEVAFDEATQSVYIRTGNGAQTQPPTPPSEPNQVESKDYAAEANAAVFSSSLPREFYNSLRHAYVNRDAISASFRMETHAVDETLCVKFPLIGDSLQMREACMIMTGEGYNYELAFWQTSTTPFACVSPRTDGWPDTAKEIQDIISAAKAMPSETERVKYLNDQVCEHLSYSLQNTTWELAWQGKGKAKCQQYATAFNYLARKSGLSTFCVSGPDHLWNMVYADGKWGHIDCTANDTGDDARSRDNILLADMHPSKPLNAPELYNFLKEVYVPGSTKS